ncbi:MAG: hypothetical protein HRU41_11650 [Saprospiraceae bacterium]|nr:hypothetical protein [Saprospiraceae bacterium]
MNKDNKRIIIKITDNIDIHHIIHAIQESLATSKDLDDQKKIVAEFLFEDDSGTEAKNGGMRKNKTYLLKIPGQLDVPILLGFLSDMEDVIYAQEDQITGLY